MPELASRDTLPPRAQPAHLSVWLKRVAPALSLLLAACGQQPVAIAGSATIKEGTRALAPAGATPGWKATGSLAKPRYGHTATLLPNGKVLVAGGYGSSGDLASAELYDPASGTWAPTGSLAQARDSHTATLLPNGKVLVVGGATASTVTGTSLASAELYDPASGTWAPAGSLAYANKFHTATLLPNGKVLVAGASPTAELYDPTSGTWAPAGYTQARGDRPAATLLLNGQVLLSGGGYSNVVELYDPASGTWAPTGSLLVKLGSRSTTLLLTGKVLVAGGQTYGVRGYTYYGYAELYDPASGTWDVTGALTQARANATATLLPNGKALVAGGKNSGGSIASAELYDPGSSPVAPDTTLTSTPPALSNSASASLAFTSTDAGGTFECSLDNKAFSACTSPQTLAGLSDGSHTFGVRAMDRVGIVDATPASATWIVDTTSPAPPTVLAPVSGELVKTAIPTLSGTAEAAATVTVFLGGTQAGTATASATGGWTLALTSALSEGTHSVTAHATDAAGNVGALSAPSSFTVDTLAPAAPAITLPAQGASLLPGTLLVSGTAEADSTISVTLDEALLGTTTAGADGTWSLSASTPVANGSHALVATATDAAGHTSAPSATVSFLVAPAPHGGCGCSSSGGPGSASLPWLAAALGLCLSRLRATRLGRRGGASAPLPG